MKNKIRMFLMGTVITCGMFMPQTVVFAETAQQVKTQQTETEAVTELAEDTAGDAEALLTMAELEELLSDRENLETNLQEQYTGQKRAKRIDGTELADETEIVEYRVEDNYAVWIYSLKDSQKYISLVDLENTGAQSFERGVDLQNGDVDAFFRNSRYHRAEGTEEKLYALKNKKYVTSDLMTMIGELMKAGYFPQNDGSGFSYESSKNTEPFSFHITLEGNAGKPMVCDPEEWDTKMTKAGNILLALVGDLEKITYTYALETGEEYHLYWDVEAANASLNGNDVKTYAESPEKLKELFTL